MIKGSNKYERLGEELDGVYTLKTFCERFDIGRGRAIYILHRLRKLGFVKSSYGAGRRRVYSISLRNKLKGVSFTEKINAVSPIQLASSNPYYIHGRAPSYEELLIYALKQKDVRYLVASLALFRRIKNWSALYRMAKKENLLTEVAALYEIARKYVSKVKRMPLRFINLAKKKKSKHFVYIIKNFSSDDFNDIENKWKIYIPLNAADLEGYKR